MIPPVPMRDTSIHNVHSCAPIRPDVVVRKEWKAWHGTAHCISVQACVSDEHQRNLVLADI